MQTNKQSDVQDISRDSLQEIAGGLLYTHVRMNDETARILESSSFLYSLIELLVEKGLLTTEELDERKSRLQKGLLRYAKGYFLQLQLLKDIIKLLKITA